MSINRRKFLGYAAAGAMLIGARSGHAIGKSAQFRMGQLQLGESWNPRPTALERIAFEIDKRTSIDVDFDSLALTLSQSTIHKTPYLYLAGDREFALPPSADIERLRRVLAFGGFLHIDSAEGSRDGAFDQSVRSLIRQLYPSPSAGLELIPKEHVVYKSFYLITQPVGRINLSATMEGVFHDGRMTVCYSQNDLGGAWARDKFGNYDFRCEPGGEQQREMAFRLGVNLAMYALCLDYKSDQVHVPFIMRRRRWRPEDGAETEINQSTLPPRDDE